jgi:hypothetical protein
MPHLAQPCRLCCQEGGAGKVQGHAARHLRLETLKGVHTWGGGVREGQGGAQARQVHGEGKGVGRGGAKVWQKGSHESKPHEW